MPESTVRRLSLYLRRLRDLQDHGRTVVTSSELSLGTGTTSEQVRKDLGTFGTFGRPGLGYPVGHLEAHLTSLLGVDRTWRVALVGAGRLGEALCAYPGFRAQGFEIRAVFDNDPAKIGRPCGGLRILGLPHLARLIPRIGIELGIIATPAAAAQAVRDLLVAAGVKGILNFAPARIEVPPPIAVTTVDLTVELESLSFRITHALSQQPATQVLRDTERVEARECSEICVADHQVKTTGPILVSGLRPVELTSPSAEGEIPPPL